ncbi:MAG: cohesin domain-containing protein [bacterium]
MLFCSKSIIPSNISVSPSSALAGKEITVCGSSFLGNRGITIDFDTHLTITTAQTNINGTFFTTFLVDTQTPGTKVITAQDTEGNLATTIFILLPPTFLKILPSYNLIAKDQEFDVNVRIEDVRNLAAVQAYLLYNPNLLEVIGIQNGSFPSGAFVSTKTTFSQVYYFAGLFTGSATGSGVLCSVRFRGKEGGSSTLTFNSNTALRDAGNIPIPFNKCEGLYYVASFLSVSPENKVVLSGNSQSYSVFAICEAGSVNVTGSATFSASGEGSFATNIFEAHYIGTYTISAEFLGLTGTTNVYITPGTPTSLLYVSGNDQTSTCTTTLVNPFVVKVEDAYHNPCLNISVSFAVISSPVGAEGYSLSSTQTLTNINGTCSSYLTLGDEPPGSYTIRASSGSLTPFDFTAWSLRRSGNIAGICLIDYGTEGQRTASITVILIETGATTTTNSNSYFIFTNQVKIFVTAKFTKFTQSSLRIIIHQQINPVTTI